jgi:hypothetical protein
VKVMDPQVCKNHNLGKIENFQDTFLGVPKLCATLMQPPMLVTKYIIGERRTHLHVQVVICFVNLVRSP